MSVGKVELGDRYRYGVYPGLKGAKREMGTSDRDPPHSFALVPSAACVHDDINPERHPIG